MGKIISILTTIYLLVGIYFAVVWGYVQATLNALVALNIPEFLITLLKTILVIVLWVVFQAGGLARP